MLAPSVRTVIDEVVTENSSRAALTSHGLRPRQRLLLTGPPGTGKSASAHAIAAELSLPVATASLAAMTSSFLGDTAKNVEAVVRFAEQTPCVVLFDEFDVLGQERGQAGDHGEMRRVAATVLQLLEDMQGESLLIATTLVEAVSTALGHRSIPVRRLTESDEADGAVAVGTMHRMKGLEFRCLAVVGVGEHQMPPSSAITPREEDEATHRHDLQRERCLLFVACTRAREELVVSWHGAPSPFLSDGAASTAALSP